jgi:hypothetical protein
MIVTEVREFCESIITKSRGRVVITPASYSRGPGFKSQPVDRLCRLEFSWFSSVSPGKWRDSIFSYATAATFHIIFKLPFTHHHFIPRCIIWLTEKVSLDKLLKQLKLSHYTPRRRLGGEGVQLLLILDLGTRWGWVVSVTPQPRFSFREKTPDTHCTGGWVGRSGHRG